MSELDRQRSIRAKLSRAGGAPPAALATGFTSLDAALGIGGLPCGRIVEVFGPPSCGKTTLALRIAARVQESGLTAAWIDADHAFDARYAASAGVLLDNLILARPDNAEEALQIACRLAASGAVDLVMVDSAAALVPKLELEAHLGESGPGLQARVVGSGLRMLATAAARSGCAALFLNQTRGRSEYGGAAASAGGPALKMYAAVRIALIPRGSETYFRILKNKAAAAFAEGQLDWSGGANFTKTP